MATVADVLDDPAFGPELQRDIDEINHRSDLWEARFCADRGWPMSKALWRRLRRYRDRQAKEAGRG